MLLLWLLVFILSFWHFFYNLFVSILFPFYDDSLTVEFIPHTRAWLLCHTLMRLILQPLMSFWWHSIFFFLVEYCNVICFYNLVICWIEKWNLENIMIVLLYWTIYLGVVIFLPKKIKIKIKSIAKKHIKIWLEPAASTPSVSSLINIWCY